VLSSQLQGEHLLGQQHYVTWSGGFARVIRNEPDRSDMAYTAAPGDGVEGFIPASWPGQPRFGVRTFTDLEENSWNGKADYRLALGDQQDPIFLKVGAAGRFTNRESGTRAYDLINRTLSDAELATSPPEDLFTADRVNASAFGLRANANGGVYTANEDIYAGYGMVDVPVSGAVRVIGGLRVERWELDVETLNTFGEPVLASPRTTDFMPSVSVNWAFRPEMMLRFAATQTVSRPEYRELSPVPYFEQIGLLTTFGNPDLNRALVQNLDARWEWYPRAGELISAGVFAKFFSDPIEKVIVLQAGTQALSFVNAEKATNYGIELEVRKGFFQAGGLPRLTTFANLTLMASDITPGNEGISSLTNPNRPMVGQSAYVVNAGFTTNPWNNGVAMSLLYNVAGRRILEAGAGGLPDAYEEARHIIDATVQWPVGQVVLRFEAKNLLDAPYRLTQGDVIRQRWLLGRQFGIGVTWQP
jgi:TonB-dependent receptor